MNHYRPHDKCTVHYSDLDVAVNLCLQLVCEGAEQIYLSKTDGQSAFHVLPLSPQSWRWLVMKAVNPVMGKMQYFVDKCLPFGASKVVLIFRDCQMH